MRLINATLGFALAALASACSVSQDEEVEIGRQNATQINAQLPLVEDPAVARYVADLGLLIARKTARADLDWKFYVVNAREVNAFALPGGFIYINRGLIERTTRLDQLAGVLGHEIGHVVQRHSVDQMQKQSGANVGVGLFCALTDLCSNTVAQAAINVGGSALFAKYSRNDEVQADSEAVVNVLRAGIDPRGVASMFGILMEARERSPNVLDAFFASHPVEQSRIDYTRDMVARISDDQLRGVVADDQNFQAFLQRVRSLPPPPPAPPARR